MLPLRDSPAPLHTANAPGRHTWPEAPAALPTAPPIPTGVIAPDTLLAIRDVLLPFSVTRLLFILISLTAPWWMATFHLQPLISRYGGGPHAGWSRWDAVWYMRLAIDGYQQAPYPQGAAFFPLYPLILHLWLGVWPWPRWLAAVMLSNLCSAGAFVALHRLLAHELGRARAVRTVWLLALFPTSLFLFAGYAEALFLLCLFLCLYRVRQQRWWAAGLCGGLAAATRPMGIILIVPFLIAWCQAHRALLRQGATRLLGLCMSPWRHAPRRAGSSDPTAWSLAAAALVPGGIVAYMLYLTVRFGQPLLFASSQRAWHRAFTAPWRTLRVSFDLQAAHPPAISVLGLLESQNSIYTLVFLALSVPATATLARAHGSFLWLVWAMILSTPAISDHYGSPLMGLPRYLLAAYPLLIFLAGTIRRAAITAALCLPLLILNTAVYLSGGWVA